MLTQEKINHFNILIQTNQAPSPEDSADFEIYKALLNSQSLAQAQATSNPTPNPLMTTPTPVAAPTVTSVSAPVAPVSAPASVMPANGTYSMDDLMTNGMVVDNYLKVKYQQTFIGNDVVGDKELYVSINLDNVVAKVSIKGGSPVVYRSTIDGKNCLSGGTWLAAVEEVQRKDPKARPYNCADLPMVIAKDVKDFSGNVLCGVGSTIGHTTSTTNWRNWVEFYRHLPEEVRERKEEIFVKVVRKDVEKNNNRWAVLDFEYIPPKEAIALGLVKNPY